MFPKAPATKFFKDNSTMNHRHDAFGVEIHHFSLIAVWWRPLVWNHIVYPDLKNVSKLAPANAQTDQCFTLLILLHCAHLNADNNAK